MSLPPLACVILAAGKGTRMKSIHPKVMQRLAGRALIDHVLAAVAPLAPARTVVVVGPGMEALQAHVAPAATAIQQAQRGTGDAVRAALPALAGFTGEVMVLYGDTPLISTATLTRLAEARAARPDTALTTLAMRPEDPTPYGRLVLDEDGHLTRIVETRDANPGERRITLCNGGIMAVRSDLLPRLLERLETNNAQGEYYLTDLPAHAAALGVKSTHIECEDTELLGINSRAELAGVEARLQARLRRAAMDGGASLMDPGTVHLCADTRLGRDVVVEPNVVFGPGVTVGDHVTIRAFCHIEGASIAEGATIGPFARLRPGAEIGEGAHIGNYVEIKKSTIHKGAKINHLSYVGDAEVGAGANVGAGTITCNYDGFFKYRTTIGAGAFIGSNTALVAPVNVGEGAIIGAGSVVTRDVGANSLAVARGQQTERQGWATSFRERRSREKSRKGKE